MKRRVKSITTRKSKKQTCEKKPEMLKDAVIWLNKYVPKYYLRHIDYKLGYVMRTRAKMSLTELQTCWNNYKPTTLEEECKALFLIQSVYVKLKRESEKLQTSVAPCNYNIGWDMAMVYTLETIPIMITVSNCIGVSHRVSVPLYCSFKPLYEYTVFFKWSDIRSKHNEFPDLQDMSINIYDFCQVYCSTITIFMEVFSSLPKPLSVAFCHTMEARMKYEFARNTGRNTGRNVFLIELNPLTDFINDYSMKQICLELETYLFTPLIQIVQDYLS